MKEIPSIATKPTKEELALLEERVKKAGVESFGNGEIYIGDGWLAHLNKCQGNMHLLLASGIYVDYSEFVAESCLCEWAYVIDLDENIFEVHMRFQRKKHDIGCFARRGPGEEVLPGLYYYPVKLLASYGFDCLPENLEYEF